MMIAQIKTMTQSERLQAMEEIWDAICHDESPLEPPIWHKDMLAERKNKLYGSWWSFELPEGPKLECRQDNGICPSWIA
jgi:hypothetical protein